MLSSVDEVCVNVTLLEATSILVLSNFVKSLVTMMELNEKLEFKIY